MNSIDVVVPCYRYGKYLRDCVHSVLAQDGAELRVLIIDDESPDETPAVGTALAREDARVTYRRHTINRGHIDTYNEGIARASGDYMLLISADDYLLPGALKRAMDLMDAHADMGLCFGEALELQHGGGMRPLKVNIDAGGRPSTVLSGADFVRLCARAGSNNVVPTPTAVVRTTLLKRLGGYRADLPHSGDLEMWLRLAAHSRVGVVKANQAVYRRHGANMSDAYLHDNCLSDLQQRKAAFDAFRDTCRGSLPGVRRLHRSLLPPLARDALGQASRAFNNNRLELARRLCDFALSVHPSVRHGLAWKMLAGQRRAGFRPSSAS